MISILLVILSIAFSPLGGTKTNPKDDYLKKEISNYLDKTFSQYDGYEYEIIQTPEAKNIKACSKKYFELT